MAQDDKPENKPETPPESPSETPQNEGPQAPAQNDGAALPPKDISPKDVAPKDVVPRDVVLEDDGDQPEVLPSGVLSAASLRLEQLTSGIDDDGPAQPPVAEATPEATPEPSLAPIPASPPLPTPPPAPEPEPTPEPGAEPTPLPTLSAPQTSWMDREYGVDRAAVPPGMAVRAGYSGWVRALRVILPLTALVILAVVLIWLNIGGIQDAPPQTVSPAPPGQTEMTGASYRGVDENARPYTLTSDRTVQSTDNPDLVELEYPMADMTLEDQTWIAIRANHGVFNQNTGILSLSGNVELFHDQGYHLKTEELDVNLKEGSATSDVRVWGQGPTGRLDSQGMRLTDQGKNIRFLGRAHMTILDAAKPPRDMPKDAPENDTRKEQEDSNDAP